MDKYLQGIKPYLLLTILCAITFFSGISSVPVMDRDEARFVQATRQMLETGDYIRINYQETSRNKKPVGIHWLQAVSVKTFSNPSSNQVWPYRLPSALGAWGAVMLTFVFGSVLFSKRAAFLASCFLASNVLLAVEAHLAKTDAVLLFFTVMTMGSLGATYYRYNYNYETDCKWCKDWLLAILFWFGLGASILVKGPLVVMILILTLGALAFLDKGKMCWLMRLYPLFGILLLFAMVYPWFAMINRATGGEFVKDAVGKDLLPKLFSGMESHGAPFGLYFVIASLTFWPASLYLWPSLVRAKRDIEDPAVRFCLAWIVPSWLVMEIVPTKLPHYVLPLYPALALIVAHSLIVVWRNTDTLFMHWAAKTWFVIWGVVGIALAGGFLAVSKIYIGSLTFYAWLAFSLGILTLYFTLKECRRLSFYNSGIKGTIGSSLMFAVVFAFLMPSLNSLWLSREIYKEIIKFDKEREAKIVSVGFHEPSLVFMMGTKTLLTETLGAVDFFEKNEKAIAIVSNRYLNDFERMTLKNKIRTIQLTKVKGINYSRGNDLELSIIANYVVN